VLTHGIELCIIQALVFLELRKDLRIYLIV
jgi:hypothetical protein